MRFSFQSKATETQVGFGVLAVLLACSLGCDPIHSVGVHGIISKPIDRDCILQSLQNEDEIANVSVYEAVSRKVWNFRDGVHEVITPVQYGVESGKTVGGYKIGAVVVQWQDKQELAHLSSETSWMGLEPRPEVFQKQARLFNVYLARRISQFCNAKFVDGLKCGPESKSCEGEQSGLDEK